MRMQSAVWKRAIPGTTETLPSVVVAAEPSSGLFAGGPADAGAASAAASFAAGTGAAATGVGGAVACLAAGARGCLAAGAELCLAASPAAGLAAVTAGLVAAAAGLAAPESGLAGLGLAPICPVLPGLESADVVLSRTVLVGGLLAAAALSGESVGCPVPAFASLVVGADGPTAVELGPAVELALGPAAPAGLVPATWGPATLVSADGPSDLRPGPSGAPPEGLPGRPAPGCGG
jgi:hypothetical protein